MATATATKLSQSQILKDLGIPQSEWWIFQGNGKAQQEANQAAVKKGLPEPFNPSAASAIIQDVLPIAAIVGVAGAAEGASAAAAADTTAVTAAAKNTAKSAVSAAASNAGKLAGALTVAGLFTNIGIWKGVSLCVVGAILVILAIRQAGVV